MRTSIKAIILTSFLVGIHLGLNAQNIKFGVFADPQISWLTSDTKRFSADGSVFGFNAGFGFERYFADRYAITSGASISNIGGILKYNEVGYSIKTRDDNYDILIGQSVKYKGQYIAVPLGLKFKTNEIGYSTFYAQLGVNGHLRLKGFVWQDENGVDREVLEKDQTYLGFVSYMIGVGMEYSLGGPSAIQTGITFTNGMTPVYKAGYGMVSVGNIALRVGLVF